MRAPGTAKRMSHIMAWTRPKPAHAPLIAAIIGFGTARGYQSGWTIVAASGLKSPVLV